MNLINPFLKTYPVTSKFGWRLPFFKGLNPFHNGTDYGTPYGTPILAPIDGVLKYYTDWTGAKYATVINDTEKIRWDFIHVAVIISPNRWVTAGEIIAFSGNSGKFTTGAHTHVSLRTNYPTLRRNYIDPEPIISILPFTLFNMDELKNLVKDNNRVLYVINEKLNEINRWNRRKIDVVTYKGLLIRTRLTGDPPYKNIQVSYSSDKGHTWSPAYTEGQAGGEITHLIDPDKYLQYVAGNSGKTYSRYTKDGKSWSKWQPLTVNS
jgi:murein DD-endopeptidase MepM/ murein hydrolase activator NlpD